MQFEVIDTFTGAVVAIRPTHRRAWNAQRRIEPTESVDTGRRYHDHVTRQIQRIFEWRYQIRRMQPMQIGDLSPRAALALLGP